MTRTMNACVYLAAIGTTINALGTGRYYLLAVVAVVLLGMFWWKPTYLEVWRRWRAGEDILGEPYGDDGEEA